MDSDCLVGVKVGQKDDNEDADYDCLELEVDRKELLFWETDDISDWRVVEDVEDDLEIILLTTMVTMVMKRMMKGRKT